MVLDIRQIDKLAAELDSRTCAVGFVGRFLDSLPRRVACVHSSLRDGKAERALVAVLSVATSAAMAGAVQLEGRSRAVERNIRAGDLTAAKAAAGELDSTIADFAHHVNKLVSSAESSESSRQELRTRTRTP